MKLWQKTKQENFGALLLNWRHKTSNRFWTQIFSWILTAFVFGLGAAILLGNIFGLPNSLTQMGARVAFLLTFLVGIVDAYFHNIVLGVETRIYQQALVQVQPPLVREWLAFLQKRSFPNRGYKYEWLPLSLIKSAQRDKNDLRLSFKNRDDSVTIPVIPVISYRHYSSGQKNEQVMDASRFGLHASDPKFSEQAMGSILSAIKEAKRQTV